jgi:hypothetical protein
MSLRNCVVLLLAVCTLAFLAGCGSSSSSATPPPSGSFSNSNLNGTYVFSVSGTDSTGEPYAMVGSFTANGQGGNGTGGITGGSVDINDPNFTTAVDDAQISGSSTYTVGVDGRGYAHLGTSTPFGTIEIDYVLQDSSHGLVTEFDENGSGSGTLDIQTASTTPSGAYAFSFAGANSSGSFATVGNFTVGSGGSSSGLEDFNSAGIPYSGTGTGGNSLSGSVVAGPSTTPATTLTTSAFGTLTFDVYPINANHLKFIETDTVGTLSGDAFAQSSTAMPVGTLAFTLAGSLSGGAPFAAGGFMVTDSMGGIDNTSTEDINSDGTASAAPITFTGSYSASPSAGAGRYLLNNFSGFEGGTQYVAYPSSGGLLLLESDSSLAIESGAASAPQSTTSLASSEGYGLNLTGDNLADEVEVDDIAEFTANSSGDTANGKIDENFPGNTDIGASQNMTLLANYAGPDSNGRGQISTGSNVIGTLNGGFLLTFYTVDGVTFPFIESDSGQVAVGVFVQQDASSSASAAAARPHMFLPQMFRPHAALRKDQQKKQ